MPKVSNEAPSSELSKHTPMMQQYLKIKGQHPNELVFYRMGDFYETFDNDARILARELEIALTSREMGKGQRVPRAGIPYHALETHLVRLVKKGYKVAICEQTSDPATSRGLVDREVVRVVTPGTVIEDAILDQRVIAVSAEAYHAFLAILDRPAQANELLRQTMQTPAPWESQ